MCVCTTHQLHACLSALLDAREHRSGCSPGTSDPQLQPALWTCACSRTINFLPTLWPDTRTAALISFGIDNYLCGCALSQLYACSSALLDVCEHQSGCGPRTSDPQLQSALWTCACSRTIRFLPTLWPDTRTAVFRFLCAGNYLWVCTFLQLHACSSALLDVCEHQRN